MFTLGGMINGDTGFWIAIVGRVIFGLGGESMNVIQTVVVSRWFFGKELAFALGLNITISRLGSVFNNLVEPPIAEGSSLGVGLLFGFIICCVSYASGIGIIVMEKIAAKRDNIDTSKLKEGEAEIV